MIGGAICAVWPGHSEEYQCQMFDRHEFEALVAAKNNGVKLSEPEERFIERFAAQLPDD